MNNKVTEYGLYAIALLQMYLIVVAAPNRKDMIEREAAHAAGQGRSSFLLYGQEVTMLDGIKTEPKTSQCTVALADTVSGDFVEEFTGLLLEVFFSRKPIRIDINDCSKLPASVFLAYDRK